MYSYEFIWIHDLREEGKHAILCHHPSSLQTPTRYHPISGITQKKQIPSTPSNQPPFHPSNSHYGKRLSTYHSNLEAYTNEPWPVSHHEHPLSHYKVVPPSSNWMLMWWSPMWWWNPAGKFQEISQIFFKMQSLTYFFFAWTFFFGRMNNLLRSEVSSCQGDLCKDSPPGWLCNSQGRAQFLGFM